MGSKMSDELKSKDRKQINIRLEPELYEFIVMYAKDNYKTVTGILRELIAKLYKENKVRVAVKNNDSE
jgi:hypothetical protein